MSYIAADSNDGLCIGFVGVAIPRGIHFIVVTVVMDLSTLFFGFFLLFTSALLFRFFGLEQKFGSEVKIISYLKGSQRKLPHQARLEIEFLLQAVKGVFEQLPALFIVHLRQVFR